MRWRLARFARGFDWALALFLGFAVGEMLWLGSKLSRPTETTMAHPAAFDEETDVLYGSPGSNVDPLSVARVKDQEGRPVVISCWKLTAEELAEIQRTGRVWLGIVGHTMPPAWIAGEKPFVKP